jgi:hypothetical protein
MVLVVYNTIVFVIPFNRSQSGFWIGYGFSTLAIILLAVSLRRLVDFRRVNISGLIFGPWLSIIEVICPIIQIIVGLVEMALASVISFKFGLVFNIIILCAYVIVFAIQTAFTIKFKYNSYD